MNIYKSYSTTTCALHCEDSWLPLDREEDHDAIVEEAGEHDEQVYMPMLFPTQFVACPTCNVEAMNNLVGDYQ